MLRILVEGGFSSHVKSHIIYFKIAQKHNQSDFGQTL